MKHDPRRFDWPLPAPAPEEAEARDERLLISLNEDIGGQLLGISPEQSARFAALCAAAWERSPSISWSLKALARLLTNLREEETRGFVGAALSAPARFHELMILAGASSMAGTWIAAGHWREYLTLEDADFVQELTPIALITDGMDRMPAGEAWEQRHETEVLAAMRHWHAHWCLRAMTRDLILRRPLREVVRDISTIADGSCELALIAAERLLVSRLGTAVGEDGRPLRLCVLAFGKHGARELNYRSDIDLMFMLRCQGTTVGAPRGIDAISWAQRISEKMVKLIGQVTEHGFLFRVDTRLRPEGSVGSLVRTIDSAMNYYHTRGSTWERQALLKVRACAGDLECGAAFHHDIQRFIFRKYLSVRNINEIKGLKHQIEARTEARDETYRDVKTGFGGIRDIEFVVQFLQLIHGGHLPALRVPDTLGALEALAKCGALKAGEAETLAEAYTFLRQVEHALQIAEGRQTHRMPEDVRELERLARVCGLRDAHALHHALSGHTIRTRSLLLRLFTNLFRESTSEASPADLVLNPLVDEERVKTILGACGLRDPKEAFRQIQMMARESEAFARFDARARTYLASMLPALLDFCSRSPDPDLTLANFARITQSLAIKGVFYELVSQRPEALRVFGSLCAYSEYLVSIINSRDGVLDEFIEVLRTRPKNDTASLAAELDARCLQSQNVIEAARWTRDIETLRIGLYDISGELDITGVQRELAALAGVILVRCLRHAIQEEASRTEFSTRELGDQIVVLGLGKIGSRMMSYRSDLDLIILARDEAALGPVTAVAQRLIRMLQDEGQLYEVDLRLRPGGQSGPLVSTLQGFAQYLDHDMQFWERIALTRARVLFSPDRGLGSNADDLVKNAVFGTPPTVADLAELVVMRKRILAESHLEDFKRGDGSMMEYEFTQSWLLMRYGLAEASLTNEALLPMLDNTKAEHVTEMESAYLALRRLASRIQLFLSESSSRLPSNVARLRLLAARCGYVGEDMCKALHDSVQQWRKTVSKRCQCMLEGAPDRRKSGLK